MSDNEKTSKADATEKTGRLIFLITCKKDKYFEIIQQTSINYNLIQYHFSAHNEPAYGNNINCFK